MQGNIYHWTTSTGFNIADAVNFFIQIPDHWSLEKCVQQFTETHIGQSNDFDRVFTGCGLLAKTTTAKRARH